MPTIPGPAASRNARPEPGRATNRPVNDITARDAMWRRFGGDDWAAFDALPPPIRRRMQEHSYDPWAVNALMLWKTFRRRHASSARAVVTLLRYLDQCEALERDAFADGYRRAHRLPLPHVAAGATVLRYDAAERSGPAQAARLPAAARRAGEVA